MEEHVVEDEIDDIASAIELSLLHLNNQNEHFVATDEASSSYNYLDKSKDEEEDIIRAIEESLKPSNLSYGRRRERIGNYRQVCDVCNGPVRSRRRGTELWNQIICDSHWFDHTPTCCGCTRFKTNEVEFIELSDGREICPHCYSMAILDKEKCGALIQECYQFFKMLEMELKEDIHFYLVDKLVMATLTSNGTSTGPVHPTSTIWGLTKIASKPLEDEVRVGKIIKVEHSKQEGHGCEVTIAVLFGLPMVMTGAILAHEMMHAWFRLRHVVNLEAKVEEGICQVIGRKWIDWYEAKRGGGGRRVDEEAQFEKNLMETLKHLVKMDCTEAYGEGFRDAQWAVSRYGLKYTINHILTYETLPQRS